MQAGHAGWNILAAVGKGAQPVFRTDAPVEIVEAETPVGNAPGGIPVVEYRHCNGSQVVEG